MILSHLHSHCSGDTEICCTFLLMIFCMLSGIEKCSLISIGIVDKLLIRAFCKTSAINNSFKKNEEVHDTS